MSVTHALARPLLAGMFVAGGADTVQHPETKVPKADPVVRAVTRPIGLPQDPALLVRVNGAVQVTAGLLLALGRHPRLAATALAASLVPTTIAGHRFWEEADPDTRAGQRVHFLKNVAMLGGLLLAATDRTGRREPAPVGA
jgi:uncharacterized membrane protein YphA (DoxX/SURF4 family)